MLADKLRAALGPGKAGGQGGKARDPGPAPNAAETHPGGAGGGSPAEGLAGADTGNGGKQES
jgi:hypothetical protein